MASVYYVDAIPGHEETVEAKLQELPKILSTTRFKEGNFDVAILVDIDDAAERAKFETNHLRRVSHTSQFQHVADPSPDLLERLEA